MKNDLNDYKNVLNYIKQYGTKDFEKIFNYYQKYCECISKEDIVQNVVLDKELVKMMYEKSKELFLYLKRKDLKISIFEPNFKKFIEEIKNNFYRINIYLDNINKLEKLNIKKVSLYDNRNKYSFIISGNEEKIDSYKIKGNWVYLKETIPESIRKIYTDGQINFFKKNIFGEGTIQSPYYIYGGFMNYYYTDILNYDWILDVSNDKTDINTHLHLKKSFNFDSSNLPNKEEIETLEIPKSLKLYYKEIITYKSK